MMSDLSPEQDSQRHPEFAEFNKTLEGRTLTCSEDREMLISRWPDIESRQMFLRWRIESRGLESSRALNPPPLTAEDFWSTLQNTSFVDRGSLAKWNGMMELGHQPFVRIGVSSYGGIHTAYGSKPGRVFLVPNRDNPRDPASECVTDRGILGLNERVWMPEYGPGPHTENQHGDPVEDGRVRPYETGDEDSDTGFVFAQLGRLYVYDWKGACEGVGDNIYNYKGLWEATGYGVVLRLDKHGVPGGVYVIWDFFWPGAIF
ncbi:hypothetical protein CSOJ01_15831 [Colletotrichum sojae]|uniref:Uncharacterized protein n=1 Tax=Colletotrichum sojae TaxID=2175907 RepID=A0A8H6IM40_9PEZI|nr:hypothetical protein CSOJ01_15831 [Colletotrichum sojae]